MLHHSTGEDLLQMRDPGDSNDLLRMDGSKSAAGAKAGRQKMAGTAKQSKHVHGYNCTILRMLTELCRCVRLHEVELGGVRGFPQDKPEKDPGHLSPSRHHSSAAL